MAVVLKVKQREDGTDERHDLTVGLRLMLRHLHGAQSANATKNKGQQKGRIANNARDGGVGLPLGHVGEQMAGHEQQPVQLLNDLTPPETGPHHEP